MRKISTREKVYYYVTHHKDRLEYISGKWFYKGEEIKNIKQHLINIDQQTMQQSFNVLEYNFKEPSDINNWIEYYSIAYGKEGMWYPPKFAELGRAMAKQQDELPPLPYPLDDKQLTIIGVMLYKPEEEVLFITSGRGGSGKSTFGNIVKQLFDNDVASCSLEDLSNEFIRAEAIKHRLIYSDELSGSDLDLPAIKMLASKQSITANGKNKEPIYVKTQSALLFCCNRPPRIDIEDTGMMRRIVYYFRDKKIENPIHSLRTRIFTEEELLIISAYAYKTLNHDWKDKFEKETYEQVIANNSVHLFMDAKDYDEYVDKCQRAKLKAYSEPKWRKIREYIEDHELPF